MSYRKYVGNATAECRMWIGGVEWLIEAEFDADESDLRIHNVHLVGWYNNDALTKIDYIPVLWTDLDNNNYNRLEDCIELWLQEFGYE